MKGPLPGGLGFPTRAIHAGQPPDPATGAVCVPISVATTFAHQQLPSDQAYSYTRADNPTRAALEECLANLEGAAHGLAFASGVAAADAILRQLEPGDHLLIGVDGYGGTWRLLTQVHPRLVFDAVNLNDLDAVARAWTTGTRLIWAESPTNPGLEIVDLAALAELAHRRGAKLVVDNTFATPYLQQPLNLGADAVMHSTTKYLGGHSDVLGGFVATNDDDLARAMRTIQVAAGAVPGPFDAFLVLRGIKTLAVRMDRHCANANDLAQRLVDHPAVALVAYPGLAAHRGHDLACRQMRAFGGMIAVTLRGGAASARSVAGAVRLFTLGESLGGVESLLSYPAEMSHAPLRGTPLAADPGLLRLSVGLEDAEDLWADLSAALKAQGTEPN
ncbi:MAG: PLP-dependent transferase [Acidimicrobiales bacterium]